MMIRADALFLLREPDYAVSTKRRLHAKYQAFNITQDLSWHGFTGSVNMMDFDSQEDFSPQSGCFRK